MPSRNRTSNANANATTSSSKASASSSSTSAAPAPAAKTSTSTSATRSAPPPPSSSSTAAAAKTATSKPSSPSSSSLPSSSSSSSSQPQISLPRNATNLVEISNYLWQDYNRTTPQRTKLLDIFLAFLAVVGAIQFMYCLVGGNYVCLSLSSKNRVAISTQIYYIMFYFHESELMSFFLSFFGKTSKQPYNAFLSGFSATVGQFVLTVSLRMQTTKENRAEFKGLSDERYVTLLFT